MKRLPLIAAGLTLLVGVVILFALNVHKAQAAFEGEIWQERFSQWIEMIWPEGRDVLINGSNHYLNFGTDSGTNGYGFRDFGGVMQCKNSGGAWGACAGSGGGGGDPFPGGATTTALTFNGGITTSALSIGTLSGSLYAVSGSVKAKATSTLTLGGEFSNTGTLGDEIGGTSGTLSLTTGGVALTKLATQAANTVLVNQTSGVASPTALATSTFANGLYAGTAGQVLARLSNGTWAGVATTTFSSGLTYASGNVTADLGTSIAPGELIGTPGANLVVYTNSGATGFAGVATTTLSGGSQIALSQPITVFGPSASALSIVADSIGDTQLTFNTGQNLTTASSPSFTGLTVGTLNGLLKGTTGVVSAASAGTDYIAGGTGLANQFTYFTAPGVVAGNAAFTLDTTAGRATFTYASTTGFSSPYASSTNAFFGTLNLPGISGTQCLHVISGVVSGTGSDCGSGSGGLTAYDAWTHPAALQSATSSLMLFNGQASSTQESAYQAYFGGTATTTFFANGSVGVSSSTPWGFFSINPIAGVGSPRFVVGSSTGTNLMVASSGNVAIGTTSAPQTLTVSGPSSGNFQIWDSTNASPSFTSFGLVGSTFSDTSIAPATVHQGLLQVAHGDAGNYEPFLNLAAGTSYPFVLQNTTANVGSSTGIGFTVTNTLGNIGASIIFRRTGGNGQGELRFYTKDSVTSTVAPAFGSVLTHGGDWGVGTTSPNWRLTAASSTGPQLTLTDASVTNAPFNFRAINNSLYISTSSVTTLATTSSSFAIFDSSTASTSLLKLDVTGSATSTFAGGLFLKGGGLTLGNITGSAQCLHVDTNGAVTGTGSDCGSGGGGLSSYDAWTHAGAGMSATTSYIGIGSSTPFAQLSVGSSSYNGRAPLFAIGSSSDIYGSLAYVFGTSSPLVATANNFVNSMTSFLSGVRVLIGTLDASTNWGYGAPLSNLTVAGTIDTPGWEYFHCFGSSIVVTVSSDANDACGDFTFEEDNTATLDTGTNGTAGSSAATLTVASAQTNDGAGFFGPQSIQFATSTPIFEARASMSSLGATTTSSYLGFTNEVVGGAGFETPPTVGCYFTASSTQMNWQAVCQKSTSLITQVDTGIGSTTLDSSSVLKNLSIFRIEAATAEVKFYMASSTGPLHLVADMTNTANIPNAGGEFTLASVYYGVVNPASGNPRRMYVDYIKTWLRLPQGF